jgi:hypothetical protein
MTRQIEIGELEGVGEPEVSELRMLPLTRIRLDGGTQLREAMNLEAIRSYALAMERGDLPPIVLYDDGSQLWLADGFHRYYAHKERGQIEIPAVVRKGSAADARDYAAGPANRSHGLRQTLKDKQRAVQATILAHYRRLGGDWSQDRIANHCGVAQSFVASVWALIEKEREKAALSDMPARIHREDDSEQAGGDESSVVVVPPKWGADWPSRVIEAAMETLAQIPEDQQEPLISLVSGPGVPPERGLQALENLAAMDDEERQRVCLLANSDSERDRSVAVAMARALPNVDPAWPLVKTCLQDLEKGLRMHRGDEAEAAFRITIQHVEGLLDTLETLERKQTNGAA